MQPTASLTAVPRAGLDGAAEAGPSAVCGGRQLSVDGRLAVSHDAGLPHPHRPQHAPGGEVPLQAGTSGHDAVMSAFMALWALTEASMLCFEDSKSFSSHSDATSGF